jgi:hypothetical protein
MREMALKYRVAEDFSRHERSIINDRTSEILTGA